MTKKFAGSAYRYFLIWGIFTALANTACTLIDALLVGNLVGSDGLAIVNLATPVFLLYALFGITIGVGANVYIGRMLGAADVESANQVFHKQLCLGIVIGVLCLAPLLFKDAWFSFLGIPEDLYTLAEQYLMIVMWSAPVFVVYDMLSVTVYTDSDPKLSAAASAVVIITNLVLDLVFMKVLDWGIFGASSSMCIAEILGLAVLFTHFLKKQRLLHLRLHFPTMSDVGKYLFNGFGMGSAQIFAAAVIVVFNTLLLRFGGERGVLAVAIYGVIYTINSIPAGVFEGASNALSTVSSFFLGESDIEGVITGMKRAILVCVAGGGALVIFCIVFSEQLVSFFGIKDPKAVEIASRALQLFAVSIIFTGINTVITAFWQSIGRARLATVMSLIRNCLLILIMGCMFIPKGNITGLVGAYICTEVICASGVLGVLLLSPSRKCITEKYEFSGRSFEKFYLIESGSMAEISGDLEQICEEWEIGMKQAFFINFICEELLLNIIKFAVANKPGQKRKYYISIKLMEKEGQYILRIRDNVSLYNPFESDGDHIDSGVLKLIRKKTSYCDYQRKMIFNNLYMII